MWPSMNLLLHDCQGLRKKRIRHFRIRRASLTQGMSCDKKITGTLAMGLQYETVSDS